MHRIKYFLIFILYVITKIDDIHCQREQFSKFPVVRHLLQTDWQRQPDYFASTGLTPDGEVRAPVLIKVTHDLVPSNGPQGIYGICSRIYRVLVETQLNPAEECRRYYKSRQAVFGDITEFYHTLVKSSRFNDTLEFPLADRFPRFSFRASVMYLASRVNEPGLMIETGTNTKHVLCVQSVRCPEPDTTTASTTTEAIKNVALPVVKNGDNQDINSVSAVLGTNSQLSSVSGNVNSDPFWDALLARTEPKNWFLATVSLSCLCLILLIALLILWLYICRIRRLYRRRRCHGQCRFGCRCPPEVIRRTATDAAVCGPLGFQTQQPFTNVVTPQGNGSVRSGSGFGNTLYGGGTLNSSRWNSNGHKIGTPLYMALNSPPDKMSLLSPGCTTPGCIIEASEGNSMDMCGASWNQPNEQYHNTKLRPQRTSQDALKRSTSEGSNASENANAGILNHTVHNPSADMLRHGTFQVRSGYPLSFSDGTSTNVNPSMIMSNTNMGHQGPDIAGGTYSQTIQNGYNYSDSGRGSGISPGFANSPTRMFTHNKNGERTFYNGLNCQTNGMTEDQDTMNTGEVAYMGNRSMKQFSNAQSVESNQFVNTGHNTLPVHLNKGSDADLLNITPPSGFYDLTNENSHKQAQLSDATYFTACNNQLMKQQQRQTVYNQTQLYPIIDSPMNRNKPMDWSTCLPYNEMIGNVDVQMNGCIDNHNLKCTIQPSINNNSNNNNNNDNSNNYTMKPFISRPSIAESIDPNFDSHVLMTNGIATAINAPTINNYTNTNNNSKNLNYSNLSERML